MRPCGAYPVVSFEILLGIVRMDAYSARRVLFPRLDDIRAFKPTPLPFGYSLSGIIWLF